MSLSEIQFSFQLVNKGQESKLIYLLLSQLMVGAVFIHILACLLVKRNGKQYGGK